MSITQDDGYIYENVIRSCRQVGRKQESLLHFRDGHIKGVRMQCTDFVEISAPQKEHQRNNEMGSAP